MIPLNMFFLSFNWVTTCYWLLSYSFHICIHGLFMMQGSLRLFRQIFGKRWEYFLLISIGLTSLAVGENAGVVALKRVVQNVAAECVEYHILTRKIFGGRVQGKKTVIERERFRLASVTELKYTSYIVIFFRGMIRSLSRTNRNKCDKYLINVRII